MIGWGEVSSPSPRSCGERVGVRGSCRKLGQAESPQQTVGTAGNSTFVSNKIMVQLLEPRRLPDRLPPGYVKLDSTKWVDYRADRRVKICRRRDGFAHTKCLSQDVTCLGLHALSMPGRTCLKATLRFIVDVADRYGGHANLAILGGSTLNASRRRAASVSVKLLFGTSSISVAIRGTSANWQRPDRQGPRGCRGAIRAITSDLRRRPVRLLGLSRRDGRLLETKRLTYTGRRMFCRGSQNPTRSLVPITVAQEPLVKLARGGTRQLGLKVYRAWAFLAC